MAWIVGCRPKEKNTPDGRPRAERNTRMREKDERRHDREVLISKINQRLRRMTADELEQELWHLERY